MATTEYLKIHDSRIKADNYIFQMTIGDYYDLIKEALNNNPYQRRKVQNSTSIYALLKEDLKTGCVMPPIVIAFNGKINETEELYSQLVKEKDKLIILDGLQRSITICDLIKQTESRYPHLIEEVIKHPIRIELYTHLSKIWLLYRMLTLNTGQTRMTTRHQIEIIYSDLREAVDFDGIKFISQIEGKSPSNLGEYKFRDVIDGFTSYVQMDYLTLDRMDILEDVKDLERLAKMESERDLFADFIVSYNTFISYLNHYEDKDLIKEIESLQLTFAPFGKTIVQIFNKSQALTGFGAAIARLRDMGDINNFQNIKSLIEKIDAMTIREGILKSLIYLDKIKGKAKRIGNDQRFFFYHFFKAMFSIDNERRSLILAAEKAYNQYERDTM